MSDNLRHWDALGKTDPAHTKSFTRAGGFRGTAIRPIESVRRMTEHFGPCGVGWGTYKPEFQLVPIDGNGEIMVFCTVGLWYNEDGKSGPEQDHGLGIADHPCVYGVGGDKVVSRGSGGLRTSDEAFKSAYTDALSNAMKHIGVGADVHMGRFDDSKYVEAARAEFASGSGPEPQEAPAMSHLIDIAREKALAGMTGFRGWYIGLTDDDRLALRPHIDSLQAAAKTADLQKP
jgi:hypothetical protein